MEIEKPAVGFLFGFFGTQKKGICDAFCDVFATRLPFPCKPRCTRPTLPTLMTLTLTLTPHSQQTKLYHYLVAVGLVDLTTDTFRPTFLSVDCLIGSWTEKLGDGNVFWWTRIDWWKKYQLPHLLINWPIYQQRCGDAYQRTQIDGCGGAGRVYFKSEASISTYWSIDQSIDLSTERRNGRRDISVGHQTLGRITWLIYQQRHGYAYRRTQTDGRAVSILNTKHQYSPIDQ